jgi:hypothetical protein
VSIDDSDGEEPIVVEADEDDEAPPSDERKGPPRAPRRRGELIAKWHVQQAAALTPLSAAAGAAAAAAAAPKSKPAGSKIVWLRTKAGWVRARRGAVDESVVRAVLESADGDKENVAPCPPAARSGEPSCVRKAESTISALKSALDSFEQTFLKMQPVPQPEPAVVADGDDDGDAPVESLWQRLGQRLSLEENA